MTNSPQHVPSWEVSFPLWGAEDEAPRQHTHPGTANQPTGEQNTRTPSPAPYPSLPPVFRTQRMEVRVSAKADPLEKPGSGIQPSGASQTSRYYLITPQLSHHGFRGNRQRNSSLPNGFCSSFPSLFFSTESKLAGERTRRIFITGTGRSCTV